MNIKIKTLHHYSGAQQFTQTLNSISVGLLVSGAEYMKIYPPKQKNSIDAVDGTLLLLPQGTVIDFKMNEKRFNFFSFCDLENYSYDAEKNKNIICGIHGNLEFPLTLKLDKERLNYVFDLFERAEKFANSPVQRDKNIAEMLMNAIFAEFAEYSKHDQSSSLNAALVLLKKLIDEDTSFRCTLEELIAQTSYSAGHLRRLFYAHYQINIAEYRSELRFAKIRELMLDYSLNMKEIADASGMRNVTHLHKFIRQKCGMTPKQLRNSLGR